MLKYDIWCNTTPILTLCACDISSPNFTIQSLLWWHLSKSERISSANRCQETFYNYSKKNKLHTKAWVQCDTALPFSSQWLTWAVVLLADAYRVRSGKCCQVQCSQWCVRTIIRDSKLPPRGPKIIDLWTKRSFLFGLCAFSSRNPSTPMFLVY